MAKNIYLNKLSNVRLQSSTYPSKTVVSGRRKLVQINIRSRAMNDPSSMSIFSRKSKVLDGVQFWQAFIAITNLVAFSICAPVFNPFIPDSAMYIIDKFSKITNKQHQSKVLVNSFPMNGHT